MSFIGAESTPAGTSRFARVPPNSFFFFPHFFNAPRERSRGRADAEMQPLARYAVDRVDLLLSGFHCSFIQLEILIAGLEGWCFWEECRPLKLEDGWRNVSSVLFLIDLLYTGYSNFASK